MRIRSAILAGFAALVAACFAHAFPTPGPISSAASGWYAAPDRMCRLVLSKIGTSINVDLFCVQDATGHPTYSHVTVDAFGHSCIGDFGVSRTFAFSGPDQGEGFVSFLGFDGAALDVLRGPDQTSLANGIGTPQTWTMIRPIASPVPFTCFGAAPVAPPIDPRSRDLACRVNPTAPSCRP